MPSVRPATLMCSAFVSGLSLLVAAGSASAQPVLSQVQVGTSTLGRPLYLISPTGDSRRFVVEQRRGNTTSADIRILLPNNTFLTTPFLTVTGLSTGDEQGLLGLAFHPNFATNGRFYVSLTNSSGTSVVREHTVSANPDVATATPTRTILTVSQDFSNHNGGWIAFGPDGFLYFALGDGGSGNDPNNRAQNLGTLLGKILRIDVDGADNIPGNDDDDGILGNGITVGYTVPAGNPYAGAVPGLDEIFAYGVRNPWRMSFDRETGDVWIADVGQEQREEVNFIPAGTLGGRNFGWRCFEGTRVTGLGGCSPLPTGTVVPILEYGHTVVPPGSPVSVLGCSITGGYVYRGSEIPWLRGTYFFSDYCSGDVVTIRYCGGQVVEVVNRTVELDRRARWRSTT